MAWWEPLFSAWLAGLLAGAMVAMPFGPLGQLAGRLLTEKHRKAAREIALTCWAMDTLMAAAVLFLLSFIPHLGFGFPPLLVALVGAALILLGAELWRVAPTTPPGSLPLGFTKPWQCAAVYSLLHPGSLFALIAAFGALHANGNLSQGVGAKLACLLGVALGVAAVWFGWLLAVHRLKAYIPANRLRLMFARGLAIALALGGGLIMLESGAW